MKENTKEPKINLRSLDDISCTNIVTARQIKNMIRKFPNMKDIAIDCAIELGNYTRFKFDNMKFHWYCEDPKCDHKHITNYEEALYKEDLNKLLVFTYRTMCDMQEGNDLSDTPEELLAYAESKLQELLNDKQDIVSA